MLVVGVPVLGIGRLVMDNNQRIKLTPPEDGRRYFITTSSRSELVRSLKADARLLRIASWLFGITGVALIAYLVYRHVFRARREARTRRVLDEHRSVGPFVLVGLLLLKD